MNIITRPTQTPKLRQAQLPLCSTCNQPSIGTRLGRPICATCAMVAVKSVMQHGITYTEPASNPYPVFKSRANFFEFLSLIGSHPNGGAA